MAIAQGSAAFRAITALAFAIPGVTVAHFSIPAPEQGTVANILRRAAAPATYGAGSFRAVTPSDTVPLDAGCRGLFVVATGTVTVKGVFDGAAVSLGTQAAGVTIPGRFGFVMATGTTATLVALYQ